MLAEMLVSISEELLRGRPRSGSPPPPDPAAALAALVDWHVDFALRHRPLIVVQDRDWESLPGRGARAGAHACSGSTSTSGPASCAAARRPARTSPTARAMAHAAFGLINSTPHSGLLPDDAMRELLTPDGARGARCRV